MNKKIAVLLLTAGMSLSAMAEKIAVIGAMDKEVQLIKKDMKNVKETKIGRITFYEGSLEGKDIVLLQTGVGKVNAAVGADTVIREFKVDKIIFTGVAGAVNKDLNITDVVISKDLVQHDVDISAFGSPLGLIDGEESANFPADKKLIETAYNSSVKILGKEHVKIGTIATGDQFIADRKKVQFIGETFGADAVEMEGAAVAQVATIYKIPFVVLRALSDKADGSAEMTYQDFVKEAANNSEKIVKDMLKNI